MTRQSVENEIIKNTLLVCKNENITDLSEIEDMLLQAVAEFYEEDDDFDLFDNDDEDEN
jgi:hypothetical protein